MDLLISEDREKNIFYKKFENIINIIGGLEFYNPSLDSKVSFKNNLIFYFTDFTNFKTIYQNNKTSQFILIVDPADKGLDLTGILLDRLSVISLDCEIDELSLNILKIKLRLLNQISQKLNFEKIKFQNEKLNHLAYGLEEIVMQNVKEDLKAKVVLEKEALVSKRLALFVKHLSYAENIDDLFLAIDKEFKYLSGYHVPVLAYKFVDSPIFLTSLQGEQFFELTSEFSWSPSGEVEINNMDHKRYLKQIFSRPFANIVSVPMVSKKASKNEIDSIFFIEMTVGIDELGMSLPFFKQRQDILSLVMEQFLLETKMNLISNQWEKTFDGWREPIAIVDNEFNLVRANQPFYKSSKKTKCHNSYNNLPKKCQGCPVPLARESGKAQRSRVLRDGRIFEVNSYPIKLKNSEVVTSFVNYYFDITEEVLLKEKLVQGEKIATLGVLAGNVAHELNNPLTGIRSFAQLLKNEVTNTQMEEDFDEIEKAAEKCQTIIKNLLDFTDQEKEDVFEVVSLNDLVNQTFPMLKTAMRNYFYNIELSKEMLSINVSKRLIQQVIFNLINNACQAMSGEGRLIVTTSKVLLNNKHFAKFSVSDTGPGVPLNLRDKIFEPFFTTKKKGMGTGLGLSLSKTIVERMGAELLLDNKPGPGALFFILFPLVDV